MSAAPALTSLSQNASALNLPKEKQTATSDSCQRVQDDVEDHEGKALQFEVLPLGLPPAQHVAGVHQDEDWDHPQLVILES